MQKITKYSDIPKMIKSSNYQVHVPWTSIKRTLTEDFSGPVGIDLDPDFQRAHVWNEEKQTRYVEYVLRGGMGSRSIYFNADHWMTGEQTSPLVLVDGKQRLQAAMLFLDNKIKAYGSYKDEFTDKFPIIDCSFTFHVNNLETRAEVLQWYIDLNDGGVVHTSEEIEKVRLLLELERKSVVHS